MLSKLFSQLLHRSAGDAGSVSRDPNKARRFFEHAEVVADARNYDYAIECYINGLRHDPDNMARHDALYEVAKRRKVAGGHPPGWRERFPATSRDPVERMLHAELLWAKDPLNIRRMINVMSRAVAADHGQDELNLAEVAFWVGNMLIEQGYTSRPPSRKDFLEVRDLFVRVSAYEQAVAACRMALELTPNDAHLQQQLRDLEAEQTMHGGYEQSVAQGTSARQQSAPAQPKSQGAAESSPEAAGDGLEAKRAAYRESPEDADTIRTLVDALLEAGSEDAEVEALEVMDQAAERTGDYAWRMKAGDLRMRRYARHLSQARQAVDAAPNDEQAKQRWRDIAEEKLRFELEQYQDRVKQYPTDKGLKHELGKRLIAFRRYDEAIGMFQQAKTDPKYRAAAGEYLGRAYLAKEWHDEAAQTLEEAMTAQKSLGPSERRMKEIQYLLMDVHERIARRDTSLEAAEKAQKVGSELLQSDINYRDIQQRMERIRTLVRELRESRATA